MSALTPEVAGWLPDTVTWQSTRAGPWPKDIVVSFLPQESTTNGVNRLKMSFHNQSADGPAAMVYFAPLAATPVRDMDVTLQECLKVASIESRISTDYGIKKASEGD